MALMPIERGKIREYAIATGAERPEYLDDVRAPIPPTFLSTVVLWDADLGVSTHDETLAACREIGVVADWSSLLSLEQEYTFHGELPRAGDQLRTSHRFDGVEVKQSRRGQMAMVRFSILFHDDSGAVRAECRYTSAFLQ